MPTDIIATSAADINSFFLFIFPEGSMFYS